VSLVSDGAGEGVGQSAGDVTQQTLTGHERERPTCQPPHRDLTCKNLVERVITVCYGGPADTEIEWWICEEHADDVRATGDVRGDRDYSESQDGYGVVQR